MSTPDLPTQEARPREYKSQTALFRQRQRQIARAAKELAAQLEEPNIVSLTRLMEIFGEALVRDIANKACERFNEARALGAAAYQPQPNGSDVATYMGVARSCGGVFFYLMRAHATTLGLDWLALHISPRTQPPPARSGQQPGSAIVAGTQAQQTQPPRTVEITATPTGSSVGQPESAKAQTTNEQATTKPNRIKATIVGTPLGAPKSTDQPGVLQLTFDVEMSTSMPKSLPTLGHTRAVVLCTEKQYRQALSAGVVAGRLIVEGEVSATLSTAGKPLLVLVCMRLTTPEAEQAKQGKAH